ncbi:hypothetical protein BDA96_01G130300 [Sorghum bicolor]|uniref:Uncharacterized protein n=2 Tax=Sorghum bicolor TaxID=4558 RepID=A0A921RXS2_SORBI|nr:hypothetical protein BDA96_01G130300 [Sorghum bicolor]KXG37774.1 hypothetical protein SORBI_3001G124900 [Sorghum bicolor]
MRGRSSSGSDEGYDELALSSLMGVPSRRGQCTVRHRRGDESLFLSSRLHPRIAFCSVPPTYNLSVLPPVGCGPWGVASWMSGLKCASS